MEKVFEGLSRVVETLLIETLIEAKNNARRHPQKQVRKLADQMLANGWTAPIMVDEDNVILAGHGRLAAAKLLGLSTVPVVRRTGLTKAQKAAVRIADNRLHDESVFDKRMIKLELEELVLDNFKLELTGFDMPEIDKILNMEDEGSEEPMVRLPSERTVLIVRVGDLWHIGPHRIICGDARDPLVYERLLGGERAQMIFADPPYGCKIEGNVSGLGEIRHENFVMGAGETSLPEFAMTLLRPALKCMAAVVEPGALAFICTDWRASPYLHDAAQGVVHEQKNLIVWEKTNAGMGTCYRSSHELIHLYKMSKGKHINNFELGQSGRHRANTWHYAGANTFRKGRMQDLADHSTVKPQKLVADAILDCSNRGGLILDAFAGSGTTLSAAHSVGRRGYGIELDPKYVEVILRRVAEAVDQPALLDGTTPYDEVAAARRLENVGDEQ